MQISVILISYNRAFFVNQALESIAQQTAIDDIHCIVVDDGSNTETVDTILSYKDKFPQFDLVQIHPKKEEDRRTTNRVAIAVNSGLKHIINNNILTQYVSYLADDDLFFKDRCEKMVNYLDKYDDVFFLYHYMKIYRCNNKGILSDLVFNLDDTWDEATKYWVSNIDNRIDHCTFMHRYTDDLWPENDIYRRCSDYGFILQCLNKNKKFAHIPEHLGVGRKIFGDSINLENKIGDRTNK